MNLIQFYGEESFHRKPQQQQKKLEVTNKNPQEKVITPPAPKEGKQEKKNLKLENDQKKKHDLSKTEIVPNKNKQDHPNKQEVHKTQKSEATTHWCNKCRVCIQYRIIL